MILNDRTAAFINAMDSGNTKELTALEDEAMQMDVPIIKIEMQRILKFFLAMKQPLRILEVGTAVGFSTLLISEYAPENCKITTIEKYEKRIPIARDNFQKAGKAEQITLLEGDAQAILESLQGSYDFVFMDAAKGQYIHFYPEIMRLLEPGGLLISDNVLQEGEIVQSRFAVTRRNRTIHARMRAYLRQLSKDERMETMILPIGDGVTVSVKK